MSKQGPESKRTFSMSFFNGFYLRPSLTINFHVLWLTTFCFSGTELVMGSIDENWYRYSMIVSILVSILRYPSKNPHHELHIHKFVTYFHVFQLSTSNFFEIFGFFRHLPGFAPFWVISLNFFLGHFWSLFQWQYRVSIPEWGIDTQRYQKVSIQYR